MPRFTTKDLLIATTLIAIGVGLLVFAYKHPTLRAGEPGSWEFPVGWFGGGALICAGVFAPFKRPIVGGIAGLVIQFLIPVLVTLLS